MKKINSIVINEKLLLQRAIARAEELSKDIDESYSRYYSHLAGWYKNIENYLNEIIGIEANNNDEFIEKVSSMDFTNNQIEDFFQLKNTPLYKKAIGLESLKEVEGIEDLLDYDIYNGGETFVYEGRKVIAFKTTEELEDEEKLVIDSLSQLFQEKIISKEECEDYQTKIYYIYEYFMSESEGEQLFAPRLSNSKYREMENNTKIYDIPFSKQLLDVIKENRKKFKEVQKMQQEYYENNKGKAK